MKHVSLFTGIGGLDLAAEWAGFETVLQVEREPYALRVLEKHWPDVPRITDVREVTSESVDGPIDVISGGFPCQPFSAAGKRRGTEDDRYLWPELLRILDEIRPSWIVGENVSGLLSIRDGMEIDDMLASLEARGYTPWIFHYPAAGVGAPHRRDRVFIVGHAHCKVESGCVLHAEVAECTGDVADGDRAGRGERRRPESVQQEHRAVERSGEDAADASGIRRREGHSDTGGGAAGEGAVGQKERSGLADGSWWESEPDVGRVAHGVPHRVDRLRALGNAVVPQQAYPIFAAIAQAEEIHGGYSR